MLLKAKEAAAKAVTLKYFFVKYMYYLPIV
jgi:hypothetical protein